MQVRTFERESRTALDRFRHAPACGSPLPSYAPKRDRGGIEEIAVMALQQLARYDWRRMEAKYEDTVGNANLAVVAAAPDARAGAERGDVSHRHVMVGAFEWSEGSATKLSEVNGAEQECTMPAAICALKGVRGQAATAGPNRT